MAHREENCPASPRVSSQKSNAMQAPLCHKPAECHRAADPTCASDAATSSDALAEFKQLWQQEYGTDLTPEEARIRAGQLVELFRLLLRPPR